jgi:DNA-binding MarR family transcriptional regulator
MKAIKRRAAEFRALQEGIVAGLRNPDLTATGDLSMAPTVEEFRSLEFLASAEPRKNKELAEYLGLAVNTITDVVDGLERKNLAPRRDDADRRVVRVDLTEAGRAAVDAAARGHLDIYGSYLSALTAEEQQTLLALNRRIAPVGRSEPARL